MTTPFQSPFKNWPLIKTPHNHKEQHPMKEQLARRGRPENASSLIASAPTKDGRLVAGSAAQICALPEIEHALAVELAAWKDLENQAAFRALRIGVLILHAKATIAGEHGDFLAWCQKNVALSRMTIWRFSKAAERFLAQKKLALDVAVAEIAPKMLADGTAAPIDKANACVQLAFDFVNGKTFTELCDDLGMPNRGLGGDTSEHRKYLSQEEKADLAKSNAEQLLLRVVGDLGELLAKKRYTLIGAATLHSGMRELRKRVQDLELHARKEGLLK